MVQHKDHEKEVVDAVNYFAKTITSGGKIVADMSSLVTATSKIRLSNLDEWERLIRWKFDEALQRNWLPRFKFGGDSTPFITWIDLCSGDGFKREKALRALSGRSPNSFFFALAVRRLNDWVAQVRKAACDKLHIIAAASDPEDIVEVLCATLPNWHSWGRLGDGEKQVILNILSLPDIAESLKKRLISATSGPMTSILAQSGRTGALDAHLIEIAESAIQPSVRAMAYRCQFEGKMVWVEGRKWVWTDKAYCKGRFMPQLGERKISVVKPFVENLYQSATDSSPIVRRVAGEWLIREYRSLGEQAFTLAKLLAADPSPSVAERGKFALERLQVG